MTPASDEAPVDCEHESSALVGFLTEKEANKHTKVSSALTTFIRYHVIVGPEVMPLAHATLANARATISQQLHAGELSALISAGDALTSSSSPTEDLIGMCRVWHVPCSCV